MWKGFFENTNVLGKKTSISNNLKFLCNSRTKLECFNKESKANNVFAA